MVARTPRLTVLAALCTAVVVMLTCWSAAALAVQTHPFVKTFGAAASVSGANGVAIDPASGEVYVSDPGNDRVEKLDPATGALDSAFGDTPIATDGRLAGHEAINGEFAGTQGLAVDPKGGALYVVDVGHGLVVKFAADGKLISGFGESGQIGLTSIPSGTPGSIDTGNPFVPNAVAVDPKDGALYASDPGNSTVDKFDSSGKYLSQIDVSGTVAGPGGVAVDAAGNLYVSGSGSVEKYDSAGADQGPLDQSGADQGVAVEASSGDVYVPQGSRIAQFSAGAKVGSFGQVGETRVQNANSVALDATGHPFVADNGAPEPEKAIFEFAPAATTNAPTASEQAPSALTSTTAHLAGTVNPEGWDTTWRFELSTDQTSWSAVGADEDAGTGTSPVAVSADPSGLQPNTHYFARLVASNGLDPAAVTAAQGFTTQAKAPAVSNQVSILDLGPTSVTLRANVNPYNATLSSCRFEYGTDASYGASAPCREGAVSGHEFVTVSASLSGLRSATAYHFRLVAANAGGADQGVDASFTTGDSQSASCPNAQLRTGPSASLPDCRAYEMVSPVDKQGADVYVDSRRIRVASGGGAVMFSSTGGFGDVHGTGIVTEYMAVRGGDGWSTHSVYPQVPPLALNNVSGDVKPGYEQATDDLSAGVYISPFPLTDDPNTENVGNLYLRSGLLTPGIASSQLLSGCPLCAAPGGSPLPIAPNLGTSDLSYANYDGASADLTHVIFESPQNLTNDAPGNCEGESIANRSECPIKLYESDHGIVRLAGVLPDGSPAYGSQAGWTNDETHPNMDANVISRDGSRIIFTDQSTGNLYMRVDGTSTIQINASERTDCADHKPCSGAPEPDPNGAQGVHYSDASVDGSRVFFVSQESLTDDNLAGFYMYDVNASAGHHLKWIAPAFLPGATEGFAVIGASSDGEYVYFYRRLYFADESPVAGSAPIPGAYLGIYVWHDGVLRFVGSAEGEDEKLNALFLRGAKSAITHQSRVTPDGLHLLFDSSVASTTGYPAHAHDELYLYSASDNALTCVSCNRSGAPPNAGAFDNQATPFLAALSNTEYVSHALSDDGRFTFFSTAEKLVPQDTNGVSDAYEYDSRTGQVHLLSTGQSSEASYFVDASPDGSNVVIATRQQLVGQDDDQLMDLYDARVDGGIAAQSPPATAPPCPDAGSCHGAVPGQPGAGAPASSSFTGPGNPAPAHPSVIPGVRVTGRAGAGKLVLVVNVPGAGRVTATGRGLKTAGASFSKAGAYRLSVKLNAAERKLLKRRHRLKVTVHIGYSPVAGAASAASLALTVKA